MSGCCVKYCRQYVHSDTYTSVNQTSGKTSKYVHSDTDSRLMQIFIHICLTETLYDLLYRKIIYTENGSFMLWKK